MQPTLETPASVPTINAAIATPNRYVTVVQAAHLRPAFSPAALRDIRFKAFDRENSRGERIAGNGSGPAGVWLQLGAKLLLDLDAFDGWLESHRMTGGRS